MVSFGQIQGPRPYQEDRFVGYRHEDGGIVLAVFDGHGDSRCAEILQYNLIEMLIKNAFDLKATFADLDKLTMYCESGSTASVVLINSDHTKATIAVLGDSPVITMNKDYTYETSPEHNVRSNPQALAEAVAKGAHFDGHYITTGWNYKGLQMSRAFGNASIREILTQEPEIYEVELSEDSWVLVASDGFVDPSHRSMEAKNDLADKIVKVVSGLTAQELIDTIEKPQDNVTVVLWRNNGSV